MDAHQLTARLLSVLETGDTALALEVFAPDYRNREAAVAPPACALPGPAGAVASGAWLRSAYSGLRYSVFDLVENGDQVWTRVRMQGRHTGPFVRFRDGKLDQVFPPTGRAIDVEHVHIVTYRDDLVVKHEALRDDLGMIRQLGFLPPRPATIASTIAWRVTGRAARAAEAAVALAETAAASVTAVAEQSGITETGRISSPDH